MADIYNKVDERLQDTNKATQKAINAALKFARPKQIMAILEIIASIIASIGINLVAFKFDFSCFKDGWFYVSSLCTLAAIILIYRGTINAIYPKTSTRPVVVEAREKYKKLNDNKGLDLEEYLKIYNRETKKEAWRAFIGKKILKWQHKKDRFRKNLVKQEKIEQECNKHITYLSKFISDEYLEEKIDSINIKYNAVYYSDFNNIEKSVPVEKKFRDNYNKAFTKSTMNKVIYYMITTALFSIGVFTVGEGSWVSWVSSVSLTIVLIIVRIATALQQADIIYDNEITKALVDKTEVLEKYYEWKNTQVPKENVKQALDKVRVEERVSANKMLELEREKHKKELEEVKQTAIKEAVKMVMDKNKVFENENSN